MSWNPCVLQLTVHDAVFSGAGGGLRRPLEDQKLRRPLVLLFSPHPPGGRVLPLLPRQGPLPTCPRRCCGQIRIQDSGDLTGQAVHRLQSDSPNPSSSSLPQSTILGASDLPLSCSTDPSASHFPQGQSVCISHLKLLLNPSAHGLAHSPWSMPLSGP